MGLLSDASADIPVLVLSSKQMSIENAQIIDIARFCIIFSAATNSSHIYRQLNLQNLSFFRTENVNFLKLFQNLLYPSFQ